MNDNKTQNWHLRLYVSGKEERHDRAVRVLRQICDEYLKGKCEVEVIDVAENPESALKDDIIATPSLVRKLPLPVRKVIGDLTNKEKLLTGLEIIDEVTDK